MKGTAYLDVYCHYEGRRVSFLILLGFGPLSPKVTLLVTFQIIFSVEKRFSSKKLQ